MNTAGPLFQVRHVDRGVEILPHPEAWRELRDTSPVLFALAAAAMAVFAPSTAALIAVGLFAVFGLMIAFVNGRLRRQNNIPLVVAADHSITYGSERIFSGGEVSSVRIVQQRNYDEPDSFGVALVRRQCASVTMPYPYFDHLPPNEAATLAVELAKALDTIVVRGPIECGGTTHPSRRFKKTRAAA